MNLPGEQGAAPPRGTKGSPHRGGLFARLLAPPDQTFPNRRYYQLLFALAAIFYPAWHWVQMWILPTASDSLLERGVIGFGCALAYLACLVPAIPTAAIRVIYHVAAYCTTAHFFYIGWKNNLDPSYTLAAIVVVTAVASSFPTPMALAGYLFMVMGIAVWNGIDALGRSEGKLFMSAVTTACFLLLPLQIIQFMLRQRLRDRGDRLDILLRSASSIILATDAEGYVHFVNERARTLLGARSRDQMTKALDQWFRRPGPLALIDTPIADFLASAANQLAGEWCYDHPSGATLTLHVDISRLRDENGITTGAIVIAADITRESELRDIMSTQVDLLKVLASPVATTDILGKICTVPFERTGDVAMTLHEVSENGHELRIRAASANFPVTTGEAVPLLADAGVTARAAVTRRSSGPLDLTTEARSWDEAQLKMRGWLPLRAEPLLDDHGKVLGVLTLHRPAHATDADLEPMVLNALAQIAIIALDKERHLSELEANRTKANAAAKMATLGEMASGIAHEINNPLGIIDGRLRQLRNLLSQSADAQSIEATVDSIANTSARIARIVSGLRTYARDGSHDAFHVVPVAKVVGDALSLCEERLRSVNIKLTVDAIPDAVTMECRETQVSQILINLIFNAVDAIQTLPGAKWIRVGFVDFGSVVKLTVADCGGGIPPDIRAKIFDPFFTTKGIGKGTGLGLSISVGLARTHGGSLTLDDQQSHTCFVLTLPKTQTPEAEVA